MGEQLVANTCVFNPAATVYVGELVNSEWRGAFGSALGFSMSLGLQYVILVGEVDRTYMFQLIEKVEQLNNEECVKFMLKFLNRIGPGFHL